MPTQTAQTAQMWEEVAIHNYKLYQEAMKRIIELQKRLDALEVSEQCVNCSCSDCDN